MDARLNPYAPGAGTPPPELARRDDVIERARPTVADMLRRLADLPASATIEIRDLDSISERPGLSA